MRASGVNALFKKVVFHSNPQAGGEIKDLQKYHKIKSLGTEKTENSEAWEAEKAKIYLPGGKQMFFHQNPEAELQITDLR